MENVAVITVSQTEWNDVKTQIKAIAENLNILTSGTQKELLTPNEVMKMLKIGRTTFDRYVREGVITTTKVSTKKYAKVYVRRYEIEKLILQDSI